jgi:hydrophobe/amphiphile efflux-1 (HAE1) family protein
MSIASLSIRRPVFTVVISISIVLLGSISGFTLGVREYPAIDPPVVSITTSFPGADASIVESQITEPIEEAVNAVAGVREIDSTSREGSSSVKVTFDLGVDLEAAVNDVRDQLGRAARRLPPNADPPVVQKSDADSSPFFGIAISSNTLDPLETSAFADNVKERLQTVPGASLVRLIGEKRYAMRLWLDPSRMAAYNLSPLDVRAALARENVELPSGRIEGGQVELSVRTLSRLTTSEDFNRLVVKRNGEQIVRLADIGYAELGPQNPRTSLRVDGRTMVGVYISPQPGANQIEIAEELHRRLAQIRRDLPAGIEMDLSYDNTSYVRSAIHEVVETLFIAFVLVVVVIFLFLRDWRSTLIPMLAIPVSIIGVFAVMRVAGFSINVLTLLAMVLAIGLVVDDAIVVLENIYSKIELGVPPLQAGVEGTKEIFLAVVATTLALCAVFLPVIFLSGMTGKLFREFGVVIASSVIISAFIALTLTPMLCVRLLRPHSKRSRFYHFTEPFYLALGRGYEWSLSGFIRRPWLALPVVIVACTLIVLSHRALPQELTPLEDRGRLWVRSTGPEGASFDYMVNELDDLTAVVRNEIDDSIRLTMTQTPSSTSSGGVANSGFVRVFLKDQADRKESQQELAARLQRIVQRETGIRTVVAQESSVGERRSGGLTSQIVLQANSLDLLEAVLPEFLDRASESPVFSFVASELKFTRPEVRVVIERDKAQTLGISAADIAATLQAALSGQRFGYFLLNGKQYEVIGQLVREDRSKTTDLGAINIKTASGDVVPLDNLISTRETSGPPQLFRYNRFIAATVSGTLNPGFTIGQGVEAMQRVADEVLDDRIITSLTGASLEFVESSSSLLYVFILALVLIYLVLAAQFESFRDPLTIMLTVPLALAGALGALWLFDQSLNIFSQIGLIMLIGLVAKNGILLVEFAGQRRAAGLDAREAMTEAASSRFRPILMTSMCTILGVVPIALALGAGAESRASMGIAVIGGLSAGTVLTLYVIPSFYLLLQGRRQKIPATTLEAETKNPDQLAPPVEIPESAS